MRPLKRVGLAVLLAVGASLLASTLARAKKPASGSESWGPINLWNVGDEPKASGQATLTDVVYVGGFETSLGWEDWYTGRLSVQCSHLTPGATYLIRAHDWNWFPGFDEWTVTASDSGGKVQVREDVEFSIARVWIQDDPWSPGHWSESKYQVHVVRLDPDGSSTTVLHGLLPP